MHIVWMFQELQLIHQLLIAGTFNIEQWASTFQMSQSKVVQIEPIIDRGGKVTLVGGFLFYLKFNAIVLLMPPMAIVFDE